MDIKEILKKLDNKALKVIASDIEYLLVNRGLRRLDCNELKYYKLKIYRDGK